MTPPIKISDFLRAAATHQLSLTVAGITDATFNAATDDSRLVRPGTLFFAKQGQQRDGHDFISDVLAAGAVAVCAQREVAVQSSCLIVATENARLLGLAHSLLTGQPENHLHFVAVTGTNGKTSTTLILSQLLEGAGLKTMVIGTTGIFESGRKISESRHTTPDSATFFKYLSLAKDAGVNWVIMETSSHGFDQARFFPVRFDYGIFTSFSQDHLDYHGTMEQYLQAKLKLFSPECAKPSSRFFVSQQLQSMIMPRVQQSTLNKTTFYAVQAKGKDQAPVHSSSTATTHQLLATSVPTDDGARLTIGARGYDVPFTAKFLLQNCLAALGTAASISGSWPTPGVVRNLQQIPGRMQRISLPPSPTLSPRMTKGSVTALPRIFVDYAHTPDALEKALQSLRPSPGRVLVVFGCGGDRDSSKRPLMGACAEALADLIWVTNDNPRTEDPARIAAQILAGMSAPDRATVQLDRRQAIEAAILTAQPEDVVLIAGKGHETYQIVGNETLAFDDVAAAQTALGEWHRRHDLNERNF